MKPALENLIIYRFIDHNLQTYGSISENHLFRQYEHLNSILQNLKLDLFPSTLFPEMFTQHIALSEGSTKYLFLVLRYL